jgi:hypothetical protein
VAEAGDVVFAGAWLLETTFGGFVGCDVLHAGKMVASVKMIAHFTIFFKFTPGLQDKADLGQ